MTSGPDASASSITCRLHCRSIRTPANLDGLNELFAAIKNASVLGGNIAKADTDRFSYWAAEPVEIFEFRRDQDKPFEKLRQVLDKYKLRDDVDSDLPAGIFCGGWIGYFSYELGRYIEKLPRTAVNDLKMPLVRLCFYDRIICYDHLENIFRLIVLELPTDTAKQQEK